MKRLRNLRRGLARIHGSIPGCSHAKLLLALLLAGCGPGEKREAVPPPRPAAPPSITTPAGMTLMSIPAGEFMMGDDHGDADEQPAHRVQLSAFLMDTREVTQKSYESLMEKNPSKTKGPDQPVEQVDWYHAVLFCNVRSLKEGLKPCYDPQTLACDFTANGYRLPTEAEWEYACRAGTTTPYFFGADPARLRAHAWFKANADQATHPTGQKTPNAWGLQDMLGNVAEWCQDIYSATAYRSAEAQNPRGPTTGDQRVLRGGSWRSTEANCRVTARHSENARFADACFGSDAYGFRCVRKAP